MRSTSDLAAVHRRRGALLCHSWTTSCFDVPGLRSLLRRWKYHNITPPNKHSVATAITIPMPAWMPIDNPLARLLDPVEVRVTLRAPTAAKCYWKLEVEPKQA